MVGGEDAPGGKMMVLVRSGVESFGAAEGRKRTLIEAGYVIPIDGLG
jgi:hypothetical protein